MKDNHYEGPDDFTGLKTSKAKTKAAGLPGIYHALRHAFRHMSFWSIFKSTSIMNQKGGFDCPGCAWPDPDDDRSALGEYCENGMKAISEESTKKNLTADFFFKNSVADLMELSDFELGKKGRLAQPLYFEKETGHYREISWKEAFEIVSSELNSLDHPDEAAFYTSGRTSNEAAFLYQLFVRQFGTNNLPDCSNMCHESSGVGLSETLGINKGSVTLEDIHSAELLIVMGQNPGTNHPRMLSALEKCVENGGEIITINPLPEAGLLTFINPQRPGKILSGGTTLTDLFLQVKINGDIALLKALMKLLLEMENKKPGSVFDHEFIEQYTAGYEDLIRDLENTNMEDCLHRCGVPIEQLEAAAEMIAQKERIIICWAMGLTQHQNGVNNIRELVNLLLLRGAIGKKGAGTCPVRGHSNVQGDRTMGIYEAPEDDFLDKLEEVFQFKVPRKHGYSTVDTISAMKDGKVKVFVAMGGNFLSAGPDTNLTGKGLSGCKLTVHVSTKLNRTHLAPGHKSLILPCLGRTEQDVQKSGPQFVTVENSMSVVHPSRGNLKPCSPKLLSEVAIICNMAHAVLKGKSTVNWMELKDDYHRIRDLIEKVIPGFANFNRRIEEEGQFYLPNGPKAREFNTHNGKANFTVNPLPELGVKEDELIMMTIRSHDQFNTTIYGLDDRYRGIYNERRIAMMNPEDIVQRGLKSKDVVDLTSEYDGEIRRARRFIVLPYDIPKGCVATYFPEANALVPVGQYAHKSKTPISKSVKIKMEKTKPEYA